MILRFHRKGCRTYLRAHSSFLYVVRLNIMEPITFNKTIVVRFTLPWYIAMFSSGSAMRMSALASKKKICMLSCITARSMSAQSAQFGDVQEIVGKPVEPVSVVSASFRFSLEPFPCNVIDRWDGQTYRRALVLNSNPEGAPGIAHAFPQPEDLVDRRPTREV